MLCSICTWAGFSMITRRRHGPPAHPQSHTWESSVPQQQTAHCTPGYSNPAPQQQYNTSDFSSPPPPVEAPKIEMTCRDRSSEFMSAVKSMQSRQVGQFSVNYNCIILDKNALKKLSCFVKCTQIPVRDSYPPKLFYHNNCGKREKKKKNTETQTAVFYVTYCIVHPTV